MRSILEMLRTDDFPDNLEPGPRETTTAKLLGAVISDFTPYEHELGKNCRNISDEVHPGLHLGDA